MNYFEIFNLPVSFRPDKNLLAKAFLAIQKRFHPDFFATASAEEQDEALEMSSLANQAIKTLRSPDATTRYVLELKGLLADEGKYQLPPGFLLEVMELNELKMEGADDEVIWQRVQELANDLYQEVEPIITGYTDEATTLSDLLKVKAYYYEKKYLDRLAGNAAA